nr:putative ribonuclease H-like domain-containing protein [Tanacetum cinerariifolium]
TSTIKSSEAKNEEQKLNEDTRAARASSTNYVNAASTTVNTACIPVNTASSSRNVKAVGPSFFDILAYANQDDYQIPNLRISMKFQMIGSLQMHLVILRIDPKRSLKYLKMKVGLMLCRKSCCNSRLSFIDPKFPKKVYKVLKALYGLHQAPKAWYATLSTFWVKSGYRRGISDKTLFIKKDQKDIMLTASTPIKTKKPLVNDAEAADVDVHLYRSMIGSLMYLTASRPDIMYAVCACLRFQVTPKTSHLQAIKRIFRYLKGQPKLGLWYPKDSVFDLEAYSDSDYARANLNRKSTTGGFQFLGRRLITWQCKKQIIVATSTTEAEYVAATNYCLFSPNMRSLGEEHVSKQGDDKKAKTRLNIEKVNFNKLDNLVGEEGVSAASETLNTATLAVSTVSI